MATLIKKQKKRDRWKKYIKARNIWRNNIERSGTKNIRFYSIYAAGKTKNKSNKS